MYFSVCRTRCAHMRIYSLIQYSACRIKKRQRVSLHHSACKTTLIPVVGCAFCHIMAFFSRAWTLRPASRTRISACRVSTLHRIEHSHVLDRCRYVSIAKYRGEIIRCRFSTNLIAIHERTHRARRDRGKLHRQIQQCIRVDSIHTLTQKLFHPRCPEI